MHFARRHFDSLRTKQDSSSNVLLLVEHPPVYTIGIRTKGYTEGKMHKKVQTLPTQCLVFKLKPFTLMGIHKKMAASKSICEDLEVCIFFCD